MKFSRAQRDIGAHLKQRKNTWVTLLVDFYGIRGDWPGYMESRTKTDHQSKAKIFNDKTYEKVTELFAKDRAKERFIPYVSMHELEALWFSDPKVLADKLSVPVERVSEVLEECGEPEKINDSSQTAPSKRLIALSRHYRKTGVGIEIAEAIGIPKMREACPLFHNWLSRLESLPK